MIPRGIRNNNPGNIKSNSITWKGMMAEDDRTPEQKKEKTFVVFRGPWWGIRAMAVILRNYHRKHGLNTVSQIIYRWAPPADANPTCNYTNFVADHMLVDPDQELNLECFDTMRRLVRAICAFENGGTPYTWEFDAGLLLAGIEPKPIFA